MNFNFEYYTRDLMFERSDVFSHTFQDIFANVPGKWLSIGRGLATNRLKYCSLSSY